MSTRVTHHVHDDKGRCEAWSHEHDALGAVLLGTFRWERSPCTGRYGPPPPL